MLIILHTLFYLNLTTLEESAIIMFHFTDEETEAWGLGDLPKVIELLRARFRSWKPAFTHPPPGSLQEFKQKGLNTDSDICGNTLLASKGTRWAFLVAQVWMSKVQLPRRMWASLEAGEWVCVGNTQKKQNTLRLGWLRQGKTFNNMSAYYISCFRALTSLISGHVFLTHKGECLPQATWAVVGFLRIRVGRQWGQLWTRLMEIQKSPLATTRDF